MAVRVVMYGRCNSFRPAHEDQIEFWIAFNSIYEYISVLEYYWLPSCIRFLVYLYLSHFAYLAISAGLKTYLPIRIRIYGYYFCVITCWRKLAHLQWQYLPCHCWIVQGVLLLTLQNWSASLNFDPFYKVSNFSLIYISSPANLELKEFTLTCPR